MDNIRVPYKVDTKIATFQGEWTAEEIDAGLAGAGTEEVTSEWYEPSASGPVLVTDPTRIQELEQSIAK